MQLSKQCNCNNKWKISLTWKELKLRNEQLPIGYCRSGTITKCPKCDLFHWFDPSLENQFLDLKSMNS